MRERSDQVRRIAETVLYEGYLLWPYRRSALKNQRRWTFGGVYPRPYSVARGEDDPWLTQTQILVEGHAGVRVDVTVRFLHVVTRRVARFRAGELEYVDELTVAGTRHLSWEEATEREIHAPGSELAALELSPRRVGIEVTSGTETEWLVDSAGIRAGAVVRGWKALRGDLEIGADRLGNGLHRLTVRVTNTTPWEGQDREHALERTLVSTHIVAEVEYGGFVSMTDPPEALRTAAEECRNIGTWPVLVGEEGSRDTVLAAPIILEDHPRVAPESPGDLFDATEIDQLLTLNILALTDEEKREMRDSDPRAREILERAASLTPEELLKLHGVLRVDPPLRGP